MIAVTRCCLLVCILSATGCEVGPDFRPPAAPAGAGFAPQALPGGVAGAAIQGADAQALAIGQDIGGQWWILFGSAELNALMQQALRNNPTLRAAQATLLQARETARAQQGALFPAISAAFGFSHEKSSIAGISTSALGTGAGTGSGTGTGTGTGSTGGAGSTTSSSAFGFSTTPLDLFNTSINVSYPLDVWGGVRRQVEEAQAQATYQRYALEAAYLTLTANIAAAAVAEASLRAQIGATGEVVRAEQDGLRVIEAQLAAGAVTRAEVLQQQAQLQTTLATLPPLQSQLAQERNLLASYVGAYPNQFHDPDFDLTSLTLPTQLPVSLPSALVEQRPDIGQSAAQLHQYTAAVGVATANLLPQITLSGSYGSEAVQLGQLFSGGTLAYSLAAQATQTLFEGGMLIHQRRASIAAMQAAAAQYQATVLNAFANVGDALAALEYDSTALRVALDAAQSASDSLSLFRVQFGAGAVNYLSVLTAQQTEQTALVTLARARAARYADTVALFQALGGGWWNRADVDPAVAKCCRLWQGMGP